MSETSSSRDKLWILLRRVTGIALALAAGFAGGLAAFYSGVPLPWMLGPLFVTAALALLGAPIRPIGKARMLGQIVVGASIGLQFTTAVLLQLALLTPVIVAITIVSTGIGMVGAIILTRLTKVDRTTAFFASTPGGVVEMANQAARYNAQLEVITVVQVMRVAFIVIVAPLLVFHFAGDGAAGALRTPSVRWDMFMAVLALAALGGLVMRYFDLPSAWFLGPLFVAAAIASFDVVTGRAPDLLLIAAQITMGTSLGTQFRQDFVTKLFRVLLAGLAAVLFSTFAHAAIGVALAYAIGLPVATMVLALAPGGMAEMVLTAKLLNLDAIMVMGFQLLRIIMLLIWCKPAYKLFMRLTEPRA
jgi:membrane AbrB-like protein